MIEVAMVFDRDGVALYWHEPAGRSAARIPDSSFLWHIIWNNKENLGGVAHTHPWSGQVQPSETDVTTFAAIEAGLGRNLVWPIIGETTVSFFSRVPGYLGYSQDYKAYWEYVKKPYWRENVEKLLEKSKGDYNG